MTHKIEMWREALETKGLKISRTKIEYMECHFSKSRSIDNEVVKIDNQEISKSEHFRYLGSMINKDGEFDDDVTYRIKVGWLNWRSASGILCDCRISAKLEKKFIG